MLELRRRITRKHLLGSFVCILLAFLLLIGLDEFPPLWWDEGWTLNTARNWVERGFYGQLLDGRPRSPGLSAAFTVVAPVSLGFRLFGVGVVQGRLPGVMMTVGALFLLYGAAKRLYGRSVAIGTLAVALLMQNHGHIHPVISGRQVMAEMPSLFYLLVGYAFWRLAFHRSAWYLAGAWLFWGIALETKAQVAPFWLASLMLPLLVAALKRWRKAALWLSLGIFGGWAASQMISQGVIWLTRPDLLPAEAVPGLFSVTAIVPNVEARLAALVGALTIGLPTLVGLIACFWSEWRRLRSSLSLSVDAILLRWSLLGFVGSAMLWFLCLAMPFTRYLFWAMAPGSILVAELFYQWSSHFDFRYVVRQATGLMLFRLRSHQAFAALALVLLVAVQLPFLGVIFLNLKGDHSVYEAADYINQHTPSGASVESYDSELLFLINRPYHYPPDALHVDLNRRTYLNVSAPIVYDPLGSDPDYLVVGPFSRLWQLYDPVLQTDAFRLVYRNPSYEIYQRRR